MAYMSELSDSARVIGAVNTVTPLGGGRFHGDNTDWLGITNSLYRHGVPHFKNSGSQVCGLVVGGGGTSRAAAYALHEMGCTKIYMANRTTSKLHELKQTLPADFNLEIIESLQDAHDSAPVSVAVSTVPADKPIDSSLLAKLEILLAKGTQASSPWTPTLLEAAYKPRYTPIMALAHETHHWRVVPGADMLVNQGVEQFKKWTGFNPPYDDIYNVVTAD